MNYSELIRQLFNINLHGGMKLELDNVLRLQQLFHFPDRSFSSIHVTGTNGKGSVTTKIAAAFQQAGYRTGLYTSPHLACFRERIRINGQMISEDSVQKHLSLLFETVELEKIPATFFELTTFLAFLHFAHEKVDVAVFETGMGGRLDATNCIHPILSVITSISLDHTEFLGSTIEEVALEKAGIIKDKIPVVIGPQVPWEPIREIAVLRGSPCIRVEKQLLHFEEENRAIAGAALEHLSTHYQLSSEAIAQGLEAKQPCRLEKVGRYPNVLLDVAHNPDGLRHLFQALQLETPQKPLRILFGLSKSKDIRGCVELIAQHGDYFHLVEAQNGRGVPTEKLYASMREEGIAAERLSLHTSISEAVITAQQEAQKNQELLLICGSFFIMGEARQALGYEEVMDSIDLNERNNERNVEKK